MGAKFFECKVKYRKADENGVQKILSEVYLVDAVSYTDAEAIISEFISAYTSEFKVMAIKSSNFSEVHTSEESDKWFKAKVCLIAYDEESGKERKSNIYFLVQADDAKKAYSEVEKALEGTMGDYTIPTITESPILEYIPYVEEEMVSEG